ncbi:putative Chromatin associated protein KTI12 [Monocercomonoides exilis]|uniref:putative Chromatin associated protein KTI12 n=1 Tax=Monocercomonoides exilis TaxID=2049356 RepID=UPI0035593D6A|nr:putative Chromatin associated protein KTI12 [Monocercomonoides exilis]|eukprot:MONOS_5539.1-p1 / transcript=MONOS_5539.1 / gene=MONOS_5539 / organism=Monocercomonoides_exilis_PA203 / gene_product=unspecified product / transcript_product=unspecified product / location=Mono_scaffold00162:73838-76704(+) / protein_length=751 / sequence_SO=supercontig / SO=protein_coding / is_pseudo=false
MINDETKCVEEFEDMCRQLLDSEKDDQLIIINKLNTFVKNMGKKELSAVFSTKTFDTVGEIVSEESLQKQGRQHDLEDALLIIIPFLKQIGFQSIICDLFKNPHPFESSTLQPFISWYILCTDSNLKMCADNEKKAILKAKLLQLSIVYHVLHSEMTIFSTDMANITVPTLLEEIVTHVKSNGQSHQVEEALMALSQIFVRYNVEFLKEMNLLSIIVKRLECNSSNHNLSTASTCIAWKIMWSARWISKKQSYEYFRNHFLDSVNEILPALSSFSIDDSLGSLSDVDKYLLRNSKKGDECFQKKREDEKGTESVECNWRLNEWARKQLLFLFSDFIYEGKEEKFISRVCQDRFLLMQMDRITLEMRNETIPSRFRIANIQRLLFSYGTLKDVELLFAGGHVSLIVKQLCMIDSAENITWERTGAIEDLIQHFCSMSVRSIQNSVMDDIETFLTIRKKLMEICEEEGLLDVDLKRNMHLILNCGPPASGKTSVATALSEHFNAKQYKVTVVNEETLGLDKTESYKEMNLRSSLKTAVYQALSTPGTASQAATPSSAYFGSDAPSEKPNAQTSPICIWDSLNYIRGFRCELFCIARQFLTTFCLVYCTVPMVEAYKWNISEEREQANIHPKCLLTSLFGLRFQKKIIIGSDHSSKFSQLLRMCTTNTNCFGALAGDTKNQERKGSHTRTSVKNEKTKVEEIWQNLKMKSKIMKIKKETNCMFMERAEKRNLLMKRKKKILIIKLMKFIRLKVI